MKARIKATGEILEVTLYEKSENAVCVEPRYPAENRMYKVNEVSLIIDDYEAGKTQINWDEKLIALSGMVMQGCCANQELTECSDKYIARVSILQAKELIKQLKEEIK